jgi:hypothetical protein
VTGGSIGGSGTIGGSLTVGTGTGVGAFLAPAFGRKKQNILTVQGALSLKSDASYTCTFKTMDAAARVDRVVANGITITGTGFSFQGTIEGTLPIGTKFAVLNNTSATPIAGTFANLPDGGTITVAGTTFQANYQGGDGNDLTLTVVP